MPAFNEKYGPWAIVAGAAEGLGEAYSTALAERKLNLVMVDNQLASMETLAEQLENKYHIQTMRLHLDLSKKDAAEQILKATKEIDTGLLVYNAAYSLIKPFVDHTPEELDTYIEVNTKTQIQLVLGFSKRLIQAKRGGGILLMSSLAGLIGMQLVAPYAATKAFAWNLAEALYHELKPYGIDVTACAAGATETPAYLKTNPKYSWPKPAVMKPSEVAKGALSNLGKRARYIPGASNQFNYFLLTRVMPRKMAAGIANKTMRKMYDHLL